MRVMVILKTSKETRLRPVFEADDFSTEFIPEVREQEERQRTALARAHAG